MKARAGLLAVCFLSLVVDVQANTYGSVEPIANPAVIDTTPLRDQSLRVRVEFAKRLFGCGIVDDVIDVLDKTHAISTVNDLNTHFQVGAGGFAGETNPAFVYTVIDDGPNAASAGDVTRSVRIRRPAPFLIRCSSLASSRALRNVSQVLMRPSRVTVWDRSGS